MTNLVEKLGASYFTEMCRGAMFVKDDKVLEIAGTMGSTTVMCINRNTAEDMVVPRDFFTGWKVFEHPTLGYRKLSGGAGFVSKRQSAMRGLREGGVRYSWSPVTSLLRARGLVANSDGTLRSQLPDRLFRPVFDTPSDIDLLVAGKKPVVVLSSEFIIEPITRGQSKDQYCVYHNERHIGSMTPSKKFTWDNAKHERLFHRLIKGVDNG